MWEVTNFLVLRLACKSGRTEMRIEVGDIMNRSVASCLTSRQLAEHFFFLALTASEKMCHSEFIQYPNAVMSVMLFIRTSLFAKYNTHVTNFNKIRYE